MILETPIDRPVSASEGSNKSKSQNSKKEEDEGCSSDHEESDAPKNKKIQKSRKVPSSNKLVEDKSVWAREIKLLESLIGMDPESSEFRALETQLSEEGRTERQKHQEQYERKLETETKKKQKELVKGQKSLDDMFKKGKKNSNTKKSKKAELDGSDLSSEE